MFVDATYTGDLMAAAGVTYAVGRQAEEQYGEDLAGVRRGDTRPRAHYTHGDSKIQAYNYRLCLTTDPKLLIPLEKPEGYREIDHELLLRNFEAGYGVSYRSIVPRRSECENLFVPVCLSASHVAHGSIRMEPVFMALEEGTVAQDGSYDRLRRCLLESGQKL